MILMRDMNLTYLVFKEQFEHQLNRKLSKEFTKDIKILRSAVIDNPTFLREFEIRLPSKYYQIRGLCLIWDKLPLNLQYEIFLQLEEKIKYFDFKKQLELKSLIDPETRYKFLYLTKRYTSHQIFGNLIFDSVESLKFIVLRRRSTKVKKPQRKRGYDDKGTLRSYDIWCHRWTPSFDWSLTDLQNKQEKIRNLQKKHLFNLINFLRELNLTE